MVQTHASPWHFKKLASLSWLPLTRSNRRAADRSGWGRGGRGLAGRIYRRASAIVFPVSASAFLVAQSFILASKKKYSGETGKRKQPVWLICQCVWGFLFFFAWQTSSTNGAPYCGWRGLYLTTTRKKKKVENQKKQTNPTTQKHAKTRK